ncbi:MAG: sulfotransferase family protein [Streptosporangiaceae bacterium]
MATDDNARFGYLPYTFSIVGVQKAGTSTLAKLLAKHQLISKAPTKELHFFDDETRDWGHPDYSEYRCPKRQPWHVHAGDATPVYLFWPRALERMRAYNPEMKLIASFRDPIERAFSQWSMGRGWFKGYPEFHDVINDRRPESLPADLPDESPIHFRRRALISRGYYGAQLRRGLESFDRDQWLLFDFHRIFADFDKTLDAMTDFLGLPRFAEHPEVRRKMASPTGLTGTAPTPDDIAGLAEMYAKDLAELTELSGLDVSDWPTSKILDGTLDPADLAEKLTRKAGLAAEVAAE